jgi:hypothetical protein
MSSLRLMVSFLLTDCIDEAELPNHRFQVIDLLGTMRFDSENLPERRTVAVPPFGQWYPHVSDAERFDSLNPLSSAVFSRLVDARKGGRGWSEGRANPRGFLRCAQSDPGHPRELCRCYCLLGEVPESQSRRSPQNAPIIQKLTFLPVTRTRGVCGRVCLSGR